MKLAAEKLDNTDEDDSKWPHNYRKTRANVPHLAKVCSNLREQLKRVPEDKMEDINVNTIWGTFMLIAQQAAIHLGNEFTGNLRATKNQPQRTVKQVFDVTRKLVKEKKEIQGISMVNWQEKHHGKGRLCLLTVQFGYEQ